MSAREKVAEAIYMAAPYPPLQAWSEMPDKYRERALRCADAAIAAHLEALSTRRWYIAAYRNHLGHISTIGTENAWLPAVEKVVAEMNRDDPETEFFVAYQDVSAWQRLEASDE